MQNIPYFIKHNIQNIRIEYIPLFNIHAFIQQTYSVLSTLPATEIRKHGLSLAELTP